MDFNKFFLPDDLLADFLIRHGFFKKSKIQDFLKTQEKLKQNNVIKNLEEIFVYKAILPKPKMEQLLSFIDFLKKRVQGILFCKMAILQKKIGPTDLDKIMITHRSIYLLKKKVLTIEDLLERKSKFSASSKAETIEKLKSLEEGKQEELYKEALLYLDKEDLHALHWREKHLQGIVGTKYSTSSLLEASKTLANKSINWLLHKEDKPEKEKEAQAIYHDTPPPSLLEVPPSQSTNIPEKIPPVYDAEDEKEEDFSDDLEKTGDFVAVSYEEPAHSHYTMKIAFALTGILVLLGFFFVYFSENKESKLVSEIQHLLENKKYQESEEKCIEFRKKYPLSKNNVQVTETLQDLLMKRADICFRQDKLSEARDLLLEAAQLQRKGKKIEEIEGFLKELEKHILENSNKEQWIKASQNFQSAIQKEDLEEAEKILQWLQANTTESQALEKTVLLSQDLQKAKEKSSLAKYCYYSKEALPPKFSFIASPLEQKNIMRMALSGQEIVHEFSEETGYFFAIASGYLYAFHAGNGKVAWIEYLGGENSFPPVFLSGSREYFNMNLIEKILVVRPCNNSLLMIQSSTGEILWETKLPGLIATRPVLHKDKAYIACLDRYCYRIDVATGRLEGAYLSGEIALFAPCFDKKRQLLYLPCTEKIYAYHIQEGRLAFTLPTPKGLASELICVASYLIATTSQKETSYIHFYLVKGEKSKIEASYLKKASLPGTIKNMPSLAGGILAVLTDTHLGCYGIHATNPQEAFFPLGAEGGVGLEAKRHGFVLFSNFLRDLIVAQGDIGIYTFQDIENNTSPPVKTKNYRDRNERNLETYQPLQRNGNLLFWARHGENYHYHLTCVRMDKDRITPLWQKQIAPCITSAPLGTQDGRILFSTHEGNLHEVYLSESNQICYRIFASTKAEGRQPLYIPEEEGRLLVVGKRQSIQLLDAITGITLSWQADIPPQGEIGKCIYANNSIFLGTESGVFAFSAQSGKKTYLEFSEFRGKPFLSGLAFAQNTLWAGSDNGNLYQLALTKASPFPYLEKIWSWETQGPIRSEFLLHENHLYFGSDDNYLYKFCVDTKKVLWKYKAKGPVRTMPILHENILYFSSEQRFFYALDASTGQLLWKKEQSGKISSPLYHKGYIYIATLSGEFASYNAKTGQESFLSHLGNPIFSSPISLGDYILVGGSDGFIYMTNVSKQQ